MRGQTGDYSVVHGWSRMVFPNGKGGYLGHGWYGVRLIDGSVFLSTDEHGWFSQTGKGFILNTDGVG